MKIIHLSTIILPLLLIACAKQTVIDNQPTVPSSSSSSSTITTTTKSSQSSAPTYVPLQANKSSAAGTPTTDEQWRNKLTAEQYAVLRENGTERPFTSELLDEHRAGTFVTADCGDPVFRSEQKFDSGTGWPSFWAPISPSAVIEVPDTTYGIQRTAIVSRCGGHLGHVFTDGPEPTGLRYCMNGVALKFIPDAVQP